MELICLILIRTISSFRQLISTSSFGRILIYLPVFSSNAFQLCLSLFFFFKGNEVQHPTLPVLHLSFQLFFFLFFLQRCRAMHFRLFRHLISAVSIYPFFFYGKCMQVDVFQSELLSDNKRNNKNI